MSNMNPYMPLTEEQKNDKDISKKKIAELIKTTKENARSLLSSNDGIKYKTQLAENIVGITKLLFVGPVNPDPVKDGFYLRATINKLGVMYDLMEDIEHDAE